MQAAVIEAAKKQPFKVLGRKLKPFSLWHQILLEELGNGWAINSKHEQTATDFLTAVYFCSLDYTKGLDELASGWWRTKVALWSWRCGFYDPKWEMGKFCEYQAIFKQYPNYWIENPKPGTSGGLSFAKFLKVKMVHEFGMTEAEAMNTPYNEAALNFLEAMEAKGLIRIMSREDEALIEQTRAMDEKLKRFAEKMAPIVQKRVSLN